MKGDKMRKKGKLIISCCILFGIMLFIGILDIDFYSKREDERMLFWL